MLKKMINFTASLMAKKTLPWISEIDAMTDLAAIEFATKQLTQDCNKGIFNDHQYLESFLSLDEKTHLIIDRVALDYVETDHIDLDYEAHIANVAYLYHRQIYSVYLKLIKYSTAIPAETLLTILARATNSISEMIKWRYYQFQSAPTDIWIALSKLYSIAENQLLQNEGLVLYPQIDDVVTIGLKNHHTTTIAQAYIKACMLGTLETLSFKAPQIDLACKILNIWSSKLNLEKEYNPKKHLFYVDLNQNVSAKRIRKLKVNSQQRYWALDSINSKIELCLSLLEFNIKPKQTKVIEITTSKQALNTLYVLRSEWCQLDVASQRRSAPRISTAKTATISYGFDGACDQVKQVEDKLSQHKNRTKVSTESISKLNENNAKEKTIYAVNNNNGDSKIIDESNKGIGLEVNKQVYELSMGMLVSISANDKTFDNKVGVIRNIKPASNNQVHMGVELLSRAAFAAETENLSSQYENTSNANDFNDTVVDFSQDFTRFTSLYLPKEFSNTKEDSLVIPMYQYGKTNTYRVRILGKTLTIKPTDTLEKHENWVRITYKQI